MSHILGKAAAGLVALSLATAPALAAQSPASKLSLRGATKSENASQITSPPIIALVGLAAIIAGGVIIATDDDDDPDSP